MISILISKRVQHLYAERISAATQASGLTVSFVHLPEDAAAPLTTPINAALLTLDIRKNKPDFARLVTAVSTIPTFKWLHIPGSGSDQFDWFPALLARGIKISTSTGANAEPVAVTALMGMLMFARRALFYAERQRAHEWYQLLGPEMPGDVRGQTAVIVGLGHVGGHLARFLKPLGVRVIGLRRSPRKPEDTADIVDPPDRLHHWLPQCDWLFMTCPLNAQTRHIMDARALALLKPGACFLNLSRGELVDEHALTAGLRTGAIGGAFMDCFESEPLPKTSPLWDMPNVIVSPHNASAATGNESRVVDIFLANLQRFARNERLVNQVG